MTAPQLFEVRLLDFSLDAYRHTSEHHDELFREFRLILAREPSPGHSVPRRLLELIDELDGRFSTFTAVTQSELEDALESGAETIDLVYRVPREAATAAQRLIDRLAETDAFCAHGDLLTLATPTQSVRFRVWLLEQFVDQINGKPPVPWSDAKSG
jgi:hypothetical protein